MRKIIPSLNNLVHTKNNSVDLWFSMFNALIQSALEVFEEYIGELDESLAEEYKNSPNYTSGGTKERSLVTFLGPIKFRRHFFYDGEDNIVYPLDDVLGIAPRIRITPDIWITVAELATSCGLTYRKTAEVLGKICGVSISHTKVKDLVDKAGEAQDQLDKNTTNKVFEGNELQVSSPDQLFCEVDGLYVKGTNGKIEIKNQITYTGWNIEGVRCSLENKKIFSTTESAEDFWEDSYCQIKSRYSLEGCEVVVNGDGAEWIGNGLEDVFIEAKQIIRQLDPFHVQRSIKRGLSKQRELLFELKKAVDKKNRDKVETILDTALGNAETESEEKRILETKRYLLKNWVYIGDWRNKSKVSNGSARGMGTIESNQRRLAYRMKRRGMKWSKKGAHAVAKVQQGITNGELKKAISMYMPIVKIVQPLKRVTRRIKNCYSAQSSYANEVSINVAGQPTSSFIGGLSKTLSTNNMAF